MIVTGEQIFYEAEHQLRRMDVTGALRLYNLAETANYDPDLCAAGRWTCHMLSGRFELAWRESDLIASRGRPDPYRYWDGQPVDNRKVLIRCLHGLGDTLQFVRYVPLMRARARSVTVEAQPALKLLLSQARIADQVITWGEQEPPWDQQIEIIELPRVFRTTLASIPDGVPYLDVSKADSIAPYDGSRPLAAGLVWVSSGYNPARSVPLQQIARLFGIRGVSFYSLQAGPEREHLSQWPHEIINLYHESGSILIGAKTLKKLDLVITVDTMMTHLAGAMGRPVWTLLPYECDWRWMMDREDSPWNPSMRLFRQKRPGDWDSVIQRLQDSLHQVVKRKRL
jgi:hypothetical protein